MKQQYKKLLLKDGKGISLDFKMISHLFDFAEVKARQSFGVKQFQNALYQGSLDSQGLREGFGVMIYDTGRLYEGQWVQDQRSGEGFELYSNGNEYKGEFKQNKPEGKGSYLWVNGDYYEGYWINGERHGNGCWYNHKEEIYDGDWDRGEATGYGIMTWKNGDRYEGQWKNCKKHGEGKDLFIDGSSYVGMYEDGIPSGRGEYQWVDGSYYKGYYEKGLKHGKGILFKKSIQDTNKWILYEGSFERDKRKGFGEVKWSNGSEYKGYFDQDERSGKGEMRWYDGTLYIGEWVLGKQHGWGSLKLPNNEIKTGYFVNNTFQGTDMQFGLKQQSILSNGGLTQREQLKNNLPQIALKFGLQRRSHSELKFDKVNQRGSQTQRIKHQKQIVPLWKPIALFDPVRVSPEEVGKIIHALQEEIKIIKLQLENLPGYSKGEVPPHLHKLKSELEKIYESLEKKNEILMNQMMKNFGKTQQDLPNFKLPDIPPQSVKRPSLYEMQSPPEDINGSQFGSFQAKGTGILKPQAGRWSGRQTYTAKNSLGGIFKSKKWKMQGTLDGGSTDPPPINEEDINKGMINLLNKGIIPRDVDLTPAFEKGAPPVMCKGVRFYEKREQNVKREIQTGPTFQNQLKFDLQPLPQIAKTRQLVPLYQGDQTYINRQMQPSIANIQFGQNNNFLALPAPGDEYKSFSQSQTIQQQNYQNNFSQSQIDLQKDRSYNELMDIYSLHEFIIRKGKVLDQTPEFISFKRTYIHKWGSISYIIHLLEKLLTTYNIDMAYVEGKQVAMLAEEDLKKPSNDLLFDCIVNKEEVGKIIKIPSRMFKGPKGPEIAAITIQKNWRMYKAHTAYNQLKFLMGKAAIIQKRFRLFQFQKQTKAKVEELTNESLFVWREMMEEFKSKWSEIKKKKRVEIHINSISVQEMKRISMEKFLQRENAQISRIFAVKDPLVEVIYISPFQMTNDVVGYYMKILEIGEIEGANSKLNIIVPDNIQKFPHHFSLSQVLMYSPKTVKRIKSLIKGKQAYIVPGITSTDDIKLSIQLQVPILSGEPSKQNLYSTKSGSKKIFQLADVPTPISAIDIYDEQEFYLSLAKLIANNMYVQTWIFKIDDEFNGRGHAYLTIDNIKALADMRRKQLEINEELVDKIISILTKILPKKVKIAMQRLYDGWQDFLQAFCKVGGVIEAAPTCMSNQLGSPSISFLIEPNGEVLLIGSMDRFSAREYINSGCFFPQQSLPNMNMMTISKSIGDILYEKGIIGHITVDLVSFPDPTSPQSHPLFWAVDLNCGMTDYSSACFFFDFLMDGQLDQFTGKYYIENAQDSITSSANGSRMGSKYLKRNNSNYKSNKDPVSSRSFMYCKYLHHPGLASIQYKTFFHMCRLESISFDLERRSGATFMLQDCLQSGVIAMMTIAEERKECLQQMVDAFKFIENQAGNAGIMSKQKNIMDESRTDEVDIADVISAVRLIYKAFVKKEEKEKIQRANQRKK